jgi:hypothetical protein
MVTARITNIVLEKDRFKVYVDYSNGMSEFMTFMPEDSAQVIVDAVTARKGEFEAMETRLDELTETLVNIEI